MNKDTQRLNWIEKKIREKARDNALLPAVGFSLWGERGITLDIRLDLSIDGDSLRKVIDAAIKTEKIK